MATQAFQSQGPDNSSSPTTWICVIFEEESLYQGGKLEEGLSGITYSLDETSFHWGVRYELEGIRRVRSIYHHRRQRVLTHCENVITDYSTVPRMRRDRIVT